MSRIVVGIDGSEAATAALAWAAREAELHDATLHLVTSFGPTEAVAVGGLAWSADMYDELELHAREVQNRAIEKLGDPLPPIEQEVALGSPATLLLEAAQNAELLVVGSRGLGGLKGLLLGSVSHRCVSHASCPVVVIPPADRHGKA